MCIDAVSFQLARSPSVFVGVLPPSAGLSQYELRRMALKTLQSERQIRSKCLVRYVVRANGKTSLEILAPSYDRLQSSGIDTQSHQTHTRKLCGKIEAILISLISRSTAIFQRGSNEDTRHCSGQLDTMPALIY